MFQDSLLIIKSDFLTKRKPLLLFLLQQGFFIKGQRKICFTPELAAEFYEDQAEDPGFMLKVILLSKGNSEAFILCKESAVEDLLNQMVCYFGTSTEMEQNIHVTKSLSKVQQEITFIFPNYIFEPIFCPDQNKFCTNNPLLDTTISTLYDIVTNPEIDPHKSWKVKLAEALALANKSVPQVSNQCSHNPKLNVQEMAQQTKITCLKHEKDEKEDENISKIFSDFSKDFTSFNVTTSSCISCSSFDSAAKCVQQTHEHPLSMIIKARTVPLAMSESLSSSTDRTAKENVMEKFIMEEHAAEVNKDLAENLVLDVNIKRGEEINKTVDEKSKLLEGEDEEILQSKIVDIDSEINPLATKIVADIISNSDVVSNPDKDNLQSPKLSVNDDKPPIENFLPEDEDPKEIVEDITKSHEENEIADVSEK
ncbi:uncharacterized protein ACRADG_013168 [Cochliomyia hominivorax]